MLKEDPVKFCMMCGVRLERKRFNGRLEDRPRFLSRKTCSQSCGNRRKVVSRGRHQARARLHRKQSCEICGTTEALHVHHIDRDWANDDPTNLQTLCASCHLKLHWREDRDPRLAGVAKAVATAARRGTNTRLRSTDGKFASAR